MSLETAGYHIAAALERMRANHLQPVFDEWPILAVPAKTGGAVAGEGPRLDGFRRHLPRDAERLRAITSGKTFADGDSEFGPDAVATHYGVFMKIGAASSLVLNHTVKAMGEIGADEKWPKAQAVLFELSEKFRGDPLIA